MKGKKFMPTPLQNNQKIPRQIYNMSSTLGFNISTIQVFTYLEYAPVMQIKIYNMQYIQRKGNVSIQKTTQILLI